MRTSKRRPHLFSRFFVFVMIVFTLLWLIPVFAALYTSIRTQGDITANGFWSLPRELAFDNYVTAWNVGQVGRYLGNSFLITIPSLIGTLFLSSLAAFALARYKFRAN